jgi:hypothetical protein
MERCIIINAKALFNLIESNFLINKKRDDLHFYYEVDQV